VTNVVRQEEIERVKDVLLQSNDILEGITTIEVDIVMISFMSSFVVR
jgi:hypothetical protein